MKKMFLRTLSGLAFLLVLSSPVAAVVKTEIISVKNDGTPVSESQAIAINPSSISNDGRYVAFLHRAKIEQADTDTLSDVYLRDRIAGTTTLLTPSGFYPGDTETTIYFSPSISGDGNYIAMYASNYVSGVGYIRDLLLIDRINGTVDIVKAGVTYESRFGCTVDYDGDVYYFDDYVAYSGGVHIYKYNRRSKVSTQLYSSAAQYGVQYRISVDDAGALVCFTEGDSTFVFHNVYLLDVATRNRILVSKTLDGSAAGLSFYAKISKDGSTVIFYSRAANLDGGGYSTLYWNLFLYDIARQTVDKVDFIHPQYGYLYPTENLANNGTADVSSGGRYVAAVLTTADIKNHVYGAVLDRQTGVVSFIPDTPPKDTFPYQGMLYPSISPDGRYVVNTSTTTGFFVQLYDLLGGNPAFAVEAGSDQVVEQESTNGSYVSLRGELASGSCSDGIFRWNWSGGEAVGDNPTVFLPAGTTLMTLEWSGCGGTATDTLTVTVQDTLVPTVDTALVGTSGQNGWYMSEVVASLSADDAGSGVREVRYRLDNGAEQIDPGMAATVAISGDGTHTLDYYAIDHAGNSNSSQSVTVRIDTIAPQIESALSGQTNNAGLYVGEVSINLTADDVTSGVQLLAYRINGGAWQTVANAVTTVVLEADGGYQVDFYGVDVAGNNSTLQTLSFVIDKTKLAVAVVENLQEMVMAITLEDFSGNNPNDASKLALEIGKILDQLAYAGSALAPAEKIQLYEWARKKLEDKLSEEINRMLADPAVLQLFTDEIKRAIAAIDAQITLLRGQL